MNDSQTPDAASAPLPDLTDDRVDALEDAVFTRIAAERSADRTRRTRRSRVWAGVGAAAAIVVVAAVLAPTIARVVSPSPADMSVEQSAVAPAVGAVELGGGASSTDSRDASGGLAVPGAVDASRDIIATGSATLVVDDVADAASRVAAAATAAGGYVESSTVGGATPVSPAEGGPAIDVYPYPGPGSDGGWVSIRVPSDSLTAVMDQLSEIGEVMASSVSRQDVTDQTVDLRARIDAAQASVTRLTELMAQAASTADLIAAESALAERQATLESYQQQLAALDSQVDLSSLSVSLQPRTVTVTADPAGFGDGLAAGWNGLVATLNGIVVALGFLLPWIVVAAVIAGIVWIISRARRRARSRRTSSDAD